MKKLGIASLIAFLLLQIPGFISCQFSAKTENAKEDFPAPKSYQYGLNECDRPSIFDKAAKLEIHNCFGTDECHNWQSVIENTKVNLVCSYSSSLKLHFRTTCTNNRKWSPPFPNSCLDLLGQTMKETSKDSQEHEMPENQSTFHTSTRYRPTQRPQLAVSIWEEELEISHEISCLQVQVSGDNFLMKCTYPNGKVDFEHCLEAREVPSKTIVELNCKPPFKPIQQEPRWTCRNGIWSKSGGKLKCMHRWVSGSFETTTELPLYYETTESPYYSTDDDRYYYDDWTRWPSTTKSYYWTQTTQPPPTSYWKPTNTLNYNYWTTTTEKPHTAYWTTTTAQTNDYLTTTTNPPETTYWESTTESYPYWTTDSEERMTTTSDYSDVINTNSAPEPGDHKKTCPPLLYRSVGVTIECVGKASSSVASNVNSCDSPQLPGTEAKYSCSIHYSAVGTLAHSYRTCQSNGEWTGTSDEFSCTLECGRANAIKIPLITHGLPTIRAQFPWHTAIFTKTNNWTYICGGSLIAPNAVVTAAHCVTENGSPAQSSSYRVDMGRFYRERLDEFVQTRPVKSIHVHPSYNPYVYDSDLAIMVFKKSVKISYHVRTICFPQTINSVLEEQQLSRGSMGTVVGWGYDETNKVSDQLKMAKLKVFSPKECAENAKGIEYSSPSSRSTTFCAGLKNQTNVCHGDSGSGMYFPSKVAHTTKWYLQGIVSVGTPGEDLKCDPTQFSVFTRVGRYADWITKILSTNRPS